MIGAIGVDLVEVDRIAAALARHGQRFLRRVYTEYERGYCQGRAPELAARFAAKEAVAKALGTGIGPVAWTEVEIRRTASGAPRIVLRGRAAALARDRGLGQPIVSLSHTHQHAIAFVVCPTQ